MRIVKVNQLVIAGHAGLSILILASMLLSDYYVGIMDETARRREDSLHLADQLLAGSKSLTTSVRAFAATGDIKYQQAFLQEQNVTRTRDLAVSGLQSIGIRNEELDLITLAKSHSDQLISLEKRAFAAGEEGNLNLAVDLVYGQAYQDALASIYQPIELFRETLRNRLSRENEIAQQQVDLIRWVSHALVMLNILVIAMLLIGFYRRRVVKPLMDLNEQLKQELSGHLQTGVGYQNDPSEVGDLARSFAEFIRLEKRVYRQRQIKRQAGEFSLALQQTHDLDQFTNTLFSRLADFLDIRCGLLHCVDQSRNCLTCAGGYGMGPKYKGQQTRFGEGLAGQCALSKLPLQYDKPPEDYLRIRSATGSATPEALLIRPLLLNNRLYGVLELAAFRHFDQEDMELLEDLEQLVVMNLANMDYQRRELHDTDLIRHSEENLRSILNGMTEGIFSLDLEGKLAFINPAGCRLLGYDATELIGQAAHLKLHHTHSDGSSYRQEECPMILTMQDAQARFVDHDVLWRKDAKSIAVSYRTLPLFDHEGHCSGSVIAFNPVASGRAVQ